MVIREVMTSEPTTVDISADLDEVIGIFRELHVRHVPVTEGGRLVGMISDRDLRDCSIPPRIAAELPAGILDDLPRDAATVMNSDVVTVDPEADVADAIDLMLENEVGALPVVDSEDDTLVGIVSYVDILRAAREAL